MTGKRMSETVFVLVCLQMFALLVCGVFFLVSNYLED